MHYEYNFDEYKPRLSRPSMSFDVKRNPVHWKLVAEGIGPSSGLAGEVTFDVRDGILRVFSLNVSRSRRGIAYAMFGVIDSNFEFDCSISDLTLSNFETFKHDFSKDIIDGIPYEDALENSFRNMPSVKIRRGFGFSNFSFEHCRHDTFCMIAKR